MTDTSSTASLSLHPSAGAHVRSPVHRLLAVAIGMMVGSAFAQQDATVTSDAQTAADATPAQQSVTDQGISGDLLASLLISNNAFRNYDERLGVEGHQPQLYTQAGRALSEAPPKGVPSPAPRAPEVFAYQYMGESHDDTLEGNRDVIIGSETKAIEGEYADFPGSYSALASVLGVTVDDNDIDWNHGAAFFKANVNEPQGKTLLTLGKSARVSAREYRVARSREGAVVLRSQDTYEIRSGQTIPFDTVLQRWQDDEGRLTELFVQKGRTDGEIRLCMNTDIRTVTRLTCNVWDTKGWRFGPNDEAEDVGTYVVDDRSMHRQGAGLMYWQSLPKGSSVPKPAGSSMGPRADAPIAQDGIRGDVLATMLTQQVILTAANGSQSSLPLRRADGPFPTGHVLADGGEGQAMEGTQDIRRSDDAFVGNGNPKQYTYWTQGYPGSGISFNHLRLTLNFSHDIGDLRLTGYGQHAGSLLFREDTANLADDTEILNYGFNARTTAQTPDQGGSRERLLTLHPEHPFSVHKGELFAYDRPLQRWSTTGGSIEMLVRKGADERQASLCLKVDLPSVKRTECSNWQLPASDWKLGTPLTSLGLSITDDRSVHEGESGEGFWLTPQDGEEGQQGGAAVQEATAQ